jgi:hypothetical protein
MKKGHLCQPVGERVHALGDRLVRAADRPLLSRHQTKLAEAQPPHSLLIAVPRNPKADVRPAVPPHQMIPVDVPFVTEISARRTRQNGGRSVRPRTRSSSIVLSFGVHGRNDECHRARRENKHEGMSLHVDLHSRPIPMLRRALLQSHILSAIDTESLGLDGGHDEEDGRQCPCECLPVLLLGGRMLD